MRNFVSVFLPFLLVLLAAAPGMAEEAGGAYERVLRTNTLRCTYSSNNPHIQKDFSTGEISGFTADVVRELVASLGLEVEWVPEVGYADFAEGLATGRYDAYCGHIAMAPMRSRVAAFTDPIYFMPFFVYVRQEDTRFSSIKDLNRPDVRAAVIDGEVFQLMTRKHLPETEEYSMPSMTSAGQLFIDVVAEKADVVIHDPLVMSQFEKSNGDLVRQALPEPIEIYPAAFAVAPDEVQLRDMLNIGIASLHNLGKIEAILTAHGIDDTVIYRVATPYAVPSRKEE